ncbi:MAG: CoA transferase [Pseudomonadales bacterium]|nr:CoA transferase [Pseudomonadales bacterium]
MGIYAGLKVLELADDIPGAVAGLACSTRGAEVIKVEPPEGDPLRHVASYETGESRLFQALNRGKRSVVIEPSEDGNRLLERIARDCDIVIASRARRAPTFAIDEARVREAHAGLIYVEVSAFGDKGPWADRYANELVMQAFSGAIMAERKTRPDGVTPATICSTRFSEHGAGLMMSIGIAAALLHRERTGEGQRVTTSLLHALLMLQGGRSVENEMADARTLPVRQALLDARAAGQGFRTLIRPERVIINPYYRAYQTRDGAMFVGALTRGLRDKARAALETDLMLRDDPDWDPKNPDHMAKAAEQQAEIERRVKLRTTAEWIEILEHAGVPTGEVVFPEDMVDTPHVRENEYLIDVLHPTAGKLLQVAPPIRYGRWPTYDARPSPTKGSDTAKVLGRY